MKGNHEICTNGTTVVEGPFSSHRGRSKSTQSSTMKKKVKLTELNIFFDIKTGSKFTKSFSHAPSQPWGSLYNDLQ